MKALNRANGGHTVSVSAPCSAPSSPSHPIGMPHRPRAAYPSPGSKQSPAHKPQAGAVKKVTGVGGTTYEISVWIAMATMGKQAICWMIICFEHSLEMCSTWDWQRRGQWGLLLWRGNHFELNRTKGFLWLNFLIFPILTTRRKLANGQHQLDWARFPPSLGRVKV